MSYQNLMYVILDLVPFYYLNFLITIIYLIDHNIILLWVSYVYVFYYIDLSPFTSLILYIFNVTTHKKNDFSSTHVNIVYVLVTLNQRFLSFFLRTTLIYY